VTPLPVHWYLVGAAVLYALMSGMSDGYWHWSTLKANVHGDFTSLHAPLRSGSTASTFDIVKDSAECDQVGGGKAIRCDYRAGRSLHISIANVGDGHATVTFMKANFDSAFYASFGVQHGCVIVERNPTMGEGPKYRNPLLDMAFISPKTGLVYPEWKACLRDTKGETP
jgi:hypothetical protein